MSDVRPTPDRPTPPAPPAPPVPDRGQAARDRLARDPEAFLRGGADHADLLVAVLALRREAGVRRARAQGLIEAGWDVLEVRDAHLVARRPGSTTNETVAFDFKDSGR